MRIIAHNQVAGCTLYVFEFLKGHFKPVMDSMKSDAGMIPDKGIRDSFLEILTTLESRGEPCDPRDTPAEMTSYLYAGEMAHFSSYMVFFMLYAEEVIRRNAEMEHLADCIFDAIRESMLN